MRNERPGGGSLVQSVDRAAAILELLAERAWCGTTEVARALGVHKATAFRLLATLQRRGLVEQDAHTAKYRLGARLAQLAGAVAAEPDLRFHARPVCEGLAEQTGETVTLDVFDGGGVVHIDQITRSSSVVGVNWLGRRTPVHCTASGKVFLAFAAEEVRARILASRLDARTQRTVLDAATLTAQLEAVVERGYGYTSEELEPGLNAVAAPVRSAAGRVVAAINLSGPSLRVTAARLDELAAPTVAAALEVSRRLGHRGA